jgi:hypothetical protein
MPGFVIRRCWMSSWSWSRAPRSVADWQEDYVFVHWGEDFRAAHSQAYRR